MANSRHPKSLRCRREALPGARDGSRGFERIAIPPFSGLAVAKEIVLRTPLPTCMRCMLRQREWKDGSDTSSLDSCSLNETLLARDTTGRLSLSSTHLHHDQKRLRVPVSSHLHRDRPRREPWSRRILARRAHAWRRSDSSSASLNAPSSSYVTPSDDASSPSL